MRLASLAIAILALPICVPAQEKQPNQDYTAFSKMVHGFVVKGLPKEFEEASDWNLTIPAEQNLPLAKLRTFVKVGDKLHMPHGTWRRFKGKIEDPDKNLKIVVKDFKAINNGKQYRVLLDADAIIFCQAEAQQWQKGLFLIGAQASADANVTAAITCDIGWELDFKSFPPDLKIEPKITELSLNLVDIKPRNAPNLPPLLANEAKEIARALVKSSEPYVKNLANDAITRSLKEGKGTISAGAIMSALPKPKPPEVKKGEK